MDQYALLKELFPLRRDLISNGFDKALSILCERFPLIVHKYPSGMKCWTWTVPQKWECQEAYVATLDGRHIIDQRENPLCIASYSRQIDAVVSRDELLAHLHTHPMIPDTAPFIFYYYQDNWGFGCGEELKRSLSASEYRVVIRSSHEDGHLKVGEWILPGEREESVVLCAHLDHPVQANDGLAGVVTGLAVMRVLEQKRLRYTYRFLITAETIGSVAWLSQNEKLIPKLRGGLFLEMTGLEQPPGLQMSYNGNTEIDHCFRAIHLDAENGAWVAPYRQLVGNDERQFNAPGVRVPMLSYARALPWENPLRPYREYHSAYDDLSLTKSEYLERSKNTVLKMIDAYENNFYPINNFKGEVCLSGCNISVDRHRDLKAHRNMLRIIDLIDGSNAIVDIAEKLQIPFELVHEFVLKLRAVGLIK